MENLDKQFEQWLRERHLKECTQCQKDGKAKLMDADNMAVQLFKEFYKTL